MAQSNAINVGWANWPVSNAVRSPLSDLLPGQGGGSNGTPSGVWPTLTQGGGSLANDELNMGNPLGLPTSGVGQAPTQKPMNSIYSPADPRYGNALFNQNTGAFGASANNTAMAGSATGQGGYAPGAAPNLESLTQMINQLNLSGQQASNAGRIPNATGLETQSSGNIGQELSGQVPQDVINLLQQQGAERGVGMGSPGSDNSNAAYLRALGLTSLQQQQLGQQNLSSALARNPGAKVFDPTSQLLTPYQAGTLNNQNALLQLDWYRALTGGGGGGLSNQGRHYGLANDLNPFAQGGSSGSGALGVGGLGGSGSGLGVGGLGGTGSWFPLGSGSAAAPYSGGGGITSTSTDGATLINTGQDFSGLFGDPSSGVTPMPLNPQDYMNAGYDPFAQL